MAGRFQAAGEWVEDPPHGGSEAPLSRSASTILADVTAAQLHDLSMETSTRSAQIPTPHGYPDWSSLPDDLLHRVLGFLPPSYLRVLRLVCSAWEHASGRFLTSLAPETLAHEPSLSQRCPNLLSLDLSHCLNEVCARWLVHMVVHNLLGHTTSTCIQVHCFRANQLGLRSLLDDHHLQSLVRLTRLTNLKLRGCSGLTSSGIAMLTHLTNLQKLDLSRCSGVDTDVLRLMPRLGKLRVLLLAGCQGVTDEGLGEMACMDKLQHLNLAGCSRITNKGIEYIVQMHGVQWVGCDGCSAVGKKKPLMSSHVPNTGLQRLNLDQCSSISDAGLVALAALPSLRQVSVSWGACVVGSGLQALAQLTSLATLDISYITPVAPGMQYQQPRTDELNAPAPPPGLVV